MASVLCCTAEQDSRGRDQSPELPNSRISKATPANRPLLFKTHGSPDSRFTSARSEDLHELREIFSSAQDRATDNVALSRIPRPRFSRPSMHSLRSLHKMTSMRSIIRRKFSKDLPGHESARTSRHSPTGDQKISVEFDTVVKQPRDELDARLGITKDALRRDLFSETQAGQGGYDRDAEILDEIACNVGKKLPGKRPSIHSIEWTSSTGRHATFRSFDRRHHVLIHHSRHTPGSSIKRRGSVEIQRDLQPYLIQKQQLAPSPHRFSQVLSTPNLKVDATSAKDRKLRRSYSATSRVLPKPSPISPLRLPSLSTYDDISWSEAMHKSLRLSHFSVSLGQVDLSQETKSDMINHLNESGQSQSNEMKPNTTISHTRPQICANAPVQQPVDLVVQQPEPIENTQILSSLLTSPTLVEFGFRENSTSKKFNQATRGTGFLDEENPRRSIHLHSMRISHHLRSGSLLSWDQLVDAPDLPTPPSPFRGRTVSDQSRYSHMQKQPPRHDRCTSSSGFSSNQVPIRWGKVLSDDHDLRLDVASSTYSSRPQSPLGSLGGSMIDLSQSAGCHALDVPAISQNKVRQSRSFPTDNDATPRPVQRYGVNTRLSTVQGSHVVAIVPLTRNNSVADTKTSKFREEFSLSPPKKRLTPSSSIAKFLNPKRLSLRSQSAANLQQDTPEMTMDGPYDMFLAPTNGHRRQSRSLISLQAGQEAPGMGKGADQVWDRAFQAHQEEKASMFLHQDKANAMCNSLSRERSRSITSRRASTANGLESPLPNPEGVIQLSLPLPAPSLQREQSPGLSARMVRRRALEGQQIEKPDGNMSAFLDTGEDVSEVVGAWGRYPSHTRHDRTFSAGKLDRVETRDFALEAAIRFASAKDETHDEDLIDPAEPLPSPALFPGEKKRKKRVGSGRMIKSNSMTFGKALMKNYAKMFRSQSTEFRLHGRGHRSSIASGGILEFPELELVPDVWTSGASQDRRGKREEDSMTTLRPRRNSSAPNLNELSSHAEYGRDQARVWSVYYDDCIPSFPRASTEAALSSRKLSMSARQTNDHDRVSQYYGKDRSPSRMSHLSTRSPKSAQVSFRSANNDDEDAVDKKSTASVRNSTMDLISKFKEQEASEHRRVLDL